MKTTWMPNGQTHIAVHGSMIIGRVTEISAKTDKPFLAVSENSMVRPFLLLQHAKDWIEELAIDVIDVIDAEL